MLPAKTVHTTYADWPLARLDGLVMTHLDDEILVYDQVAHAIHHLNPTSHAVWAACDGTLNVQGIVHATTTTLGAAVSEEVVHLALAQLTAANLLVAAPPARNTQPRQSRRTMLRRAAVAGGIALPVLVSVTAPTAAQTASCNCQLPECKKWIDPDRCNCEAYIGDPSLVDLSCSSGAGHCNEFGDCVINS